MHYIARECATWELGNDLVCSEVIAWYSVSAVAVSEGRRAYVLVNNRCEGNAPLTVQGLAEMLRG